MLAGCWHGWNAGATRAKEGLLAAPAAAGEKGDGRGDGARTSQICAPLLHPPLPGAPQGAGPPRSSRGHMSGLAPEPPPLLEFQELQEFQERLHSSFSPPSFPSAFSCPTGTNYFGLFSAPYSTHQNQKNISRVAPAARPPLCPRRRRRRGPPPAAPPPAGRTIAAGPRLFSGIPGELHPRPLLADFGNWQRPS